MPSQFWRKFRVAFRWCRLSILLLMLAGACLLLWFNLVGLPAAFKRPLLADLQKRGISLTFSRLRLRMTRGLVAEDVHAVAADNPGGPNLSLGEVQLLVDFPSLLHGHLHIDGLVLREGRLVIPVEDSGPPAKALVLDQIQTEVRFQDDTWSLDNFTANFRGASLSLTGDIAHAREFRNWDIFHPARKTGPPGDWRKRLRDIDQIVEEIHLEGKPWLVLNVEGDARNLHSFAVSVQLGGLAVRTPWFGARDLKFKANLTIPSDTPTNLALQGIQGKLAPYRLAWSSHFTEMTAPGVSAGTVDASGFWRAPDMALTLHLQKAAESSSHPVSVQNLELNAYLTAPAGQATNLVLAGVWSNLQPWQLSWSARANRLRSEKLAVEAVTANGYWWSPKLAVNSLTVRLGHGSLQASLGFDAASNRLTFTNSSCFELDAVEPLLPPSLREQLALFKWSAPPTFHAAGEVDLSPWLIPAASGSRPSPAITLEGDAAFTNARVAGFLLDEVQTRFGYSNLVWEVPDLQVSRDQTRLRMSGSEDEKTKLFEARLRGNVDLNQFRPLITGKSGARELGRLTFNDPLALDFSVRGNIHDPSTLAAAGSLALTNFAARGGRADSLVTGLTYSNRVIEFDHPFALREHGSEILRADGITLDLNAHRISFTNGFSTATPQFVADCIGPKTGRTLEPYQFLKPPTARVNGYVSLLSSEDDDSEQSRDDLQVDILQGAPFRWLRFASGDLTGSATWLGPTLTLTGLNAEFYGGRAAGSAQFDFRPVNGTDYQFAFDITNASLHAVVASLADPTNQLDGHFSGRIVCTSGNSTNWQGMNGYGQASLRDGLLWDAPMFGILSPALNALVPGMGSSRATDAAGQFTMTNGVLHSDSLEIHSTMMRLHYDGTVDLHENLNARATAQLLRDTPGLGSVFHIITWPVSKLFEYKVTGTLADPKIAPANDLAKLLLAPFHPIKTIEHILPAGNTNAVISTNTPPRH